MISHAERGLTNTSMTALSITDLIQLSQGVQRGSSTLDDEFNSDNEVNESGESDTEEQNFQNESEGEVEVGEVEGPGLHIVWRFERLFANRNELQDFLNTEDCWATGPKRHQTKGFKTWYRCDKVKINSFKG